MDKLKHTKIVATISDKKCDLEFLETLFKAGMNVVRINTAHQTPESASFIIERIREISDSIAILIDTKGPEVRTKNIDSPLAVKRGDKLKIKGGEGKPIDSLFYVNYTGFANDVSIGDSILIDDGELELTVVGKNGESLEVVVENDGEIKNRKSINVPGVSMTLPSVTEKDKLFINWAVENEIDFIAHSFVRNKEDVLAVQDIIDKKKGDIKIIAKIENLDGVNNIEEILDYAYGVMVARGDLGIEIPYEKIPGIQRGLIRKCVERRKPVIIATQMLHSMINNPRPTRAEVSDVANAIFYRTDAIMLSGETAYGEYAVEAVKVMASVANEVENSKDHRNDLPVFSTGHDIPLILAEAAVSAAKELDVKAIVTDTLSGRTARYLAAFRSSKPVFAKCHNPRVKRELALSYGVYADVIKIKKNKDKLVRNALCRLVTKGYLESTDNVVYVGGGFGVGGGTTFMEIANVERMTLKNEEESGSSCKS
jgi:pyruvate kinase